MIDKVSSFPVESDSREVHNAAPAASGCVAAYVITLDEERHIRRCLSSLKLITDHILVLDSGSTDRTCAIAESLGAVVQQRTFDDYASQRNAAIDAVVAEFGISYICSLDADEYFEPDAAESIRQWAAQPTADVLLLPRLVVFEGRTLRWGNRRRVLLPRVFRSDMRMEPRPVNEHLAVPPSARVEVLEAPIIHDDQLTWRQLADKHVRYAEAEARIAASQPRTRFRLPPRQAHLRNRWLRETFYARLPLKPAIAFTVQYVVRLGFLDGRPGLDRALLDGFKEFLIVRMRKEYVGTEQGNRQ